MAYKKSYAKKPYKKRATVRKGGKAASTRHIKAIVTRTLRKSTEVKHWSTGWDEQNVSTLSQSPDSSGVLKNMTQLSQGTGIDNRIGNAVKLIGLQINCVFKNNASGTNYIRFMVLSPKNVLDSTDTLDSTLLEDSGTTDVPVTTGATGLNAMYYPINKESVRCIYQRVFRLGQAGDSSGRDTIFFKKFIKLNQKVTYTSSAFTSCRSGQLLITAIAAEAADDTGVGTNVELSGFSRVYYTDM